jgi:hypothetical protein
MKKDTFTNDDIKNLVIRPQILKRDNYTCSCCGIPHKSRVYINTRKNYVLCDDFTENWALTQGKKVFTVYLNVVNVTTLEFSADPAHYLSLCPRHTQLHSMQMIAKFKAEIKTALNKFGAKKPDNFDFYRLGIIDTLIKDIKAITSVKITANEADSIINNLINQIK